MAWNFSRSSSGTSSLVGLGEDARVELEPRELAVQVERAGPDVGGVAPGRWELEGGAEGMTEVGISEAGTAGATLPAPEARDADSAAGRRTR